MKDVKVKGYTREKKNEYGSTEFWQTYYALAPRHRRVFANLVNDGETIDSAMDIIRDEAFGDELK